MQYVEDQDCPLCKRSRGKEAIASNTLAMALPDGYPLNPGHTLVVPRRHASDFFELSPAEHTAMLDIVRQVKRTLQASYKPDGFNVGINCGEAAGQTIGHAHLHLIPRFAGDVADPRGGVRWVLPAKAPYWNDSQEQDD